MRELALTGRDFTAEEALKMGFVTRLCADREALSGRRRALRTRSPALPPLAVQGTKEMLLQGRDNGVQAGLAYIAQKNAALIPNEDMMEAVGGLPGEAQAGLQGAVGGDIPIRKRNTALDRLPQNRI